MWFSKHKQTGNKQKVKKQKDKKLSKEQKKKIKNRRKRAAKRQSLFKGQDGFFSDEGYVEYHGYLRKGKTKDYASVFDVKFKYGTNNPASIGWVNMLIPSNNLKNGRVFFAMREKRMSKSAENEAMGKTIRARQVTMLNQKSSNDLREDSKKDAELDDISQAQKLAKTEGIVDSDITLVVKAKSPEKLEETVDELKQDYKDRGLKGIMFIRKTAQQLEAIKNLPHHVSADAWHNSYMASWEAAQLFFPSSGFADKHGAYLGQDLHAYQYGTPALVDFNKVRNAVIMTGGSRGNLSIGGFEGVSEQPLGNFGSAWAHVIADDNYLVNGTRTFHIVLVPFNYHSYNSLIFDLSKDNTINSLECFGTKENVQADANNNFDKIVEIIMMLLEDEHPDPAIRTLVYKQLVDWVIYRARGTGMYSADPVYEPTRAYKILATTNHATYPTLQEFIPDLQSMVSGERNKGERAGEKAERILNAVLTASRRFPQMFNDKTNIPDSFGFKDRNIYFDLSGVGGKEMIRGAMFLNVLAYVVNRAQPEDMIVIHGLDSIKINPKVIAPYRRKMDEKGVGLITTFEKEYDPDMNVKTLADFTHPLTQQDIVIIGGLSKEQNEMIESSWNRSLPEIVQDDLKQQHDNMFYLYRKRDFGSAVIDTHLVL